jgi:uncharacterized protein (TIRG00374 family)
MSRKKPLKNIIKVIVTCAGLYLAYRQIDPKILNTDWRDYNIWLFVLAAVLSVLSVFFTSSRLYVILRKRVPFFYILKSDYIASFFNIFLPSTIGGDVVKISKVSGYSGSFRNSTVGVILDRFFGIVSLIILCAVFSIVGVVTKTIDLPLYLILVMVAILVLVIILFIVLLKIDLTKFKEKTFEVKIFNFRKTANIGKWVQAVYEIREIPLKDLLLVLMISFGYNLNGALIAYIVLEFLHVNISLSYVILFRSISTILLMLPISISGLGVRDYVYKELYGSVTSSPQVLLLAPVTFILICMIGIVGGIIFLFDKKAKEES